jgi:hypothetical protein
LANAVAGVAWLIRTTLRQPSDVVICGPIIVGEPHVPVPGGSVLSTSVAAPSVATNADRVPLAYLASHQRANEKDPGVNWARGFGGMRRWSPPIGW